MTITRKFTVALLLASILLGVPGTSTGRADNGGNAIAKAGAIDTQLTDELKLANEALYEAFASRDIYRMGQSWVEDEGASSIFPAESMPQYGWENVRQSWQYSFDHIRDIQLSSLAGIIIVDSDEEGAIAWIIDSNRLEGVHTQTGQPFIMPNMLTTKIFERRDGEWRVVHYHAHQPRLQPPTATHELSLKRPLDPVHAPEVEAADDRFYNALRNQSLEEMDRIWASSKDVTVVQPDIGMPFVGKANVMASWKSLFEHNKKIGITNVEREVFLRGNIAWTVGSYEFHALRQTDGEFIHVPKIVVTKILEKTDGGWGIVHYHGHIGPQAHEHDLGSAGGQGGHDMASAGHDGDSNMVFVKCAKCHQVGPEAGNVVGPHLNGIFGRKAGSVANYGMYSSGMKKLGDQGFSWTEETLDEWIADPKKLLPESPMAFAFPGIPDASQRKEVIQYLKSFSN